MKTGPCPECNSTEVYFGNVRERGGGLRDEHNVFIPANHHPLYANTYICLECGNVRLFLDEKGMIDANNEIPKTKEWTKVT